MRSPAEAKKTRVLPRCARRKAIFAFTVHRQGLTVSAIARHLQLDAAFAALGGVQQAILHDRMKTAPARASQAC
jgi:hypothetical protein